jgi:hypothetical protein
MDDEGTARRLVGLEIGPEQPVHGTLALVRSGDGEKTRRLVDDQEVVILVDETEGERERDRAVVAEVDPRRRAHGGPAVTDDAAVDLDASVHEPLLHAAPGGLGKELAEPFEENHRILSGLAPGSYRMTFFSLSTLIRAGE